MGEIRTKGREAYRDFNTDGVPSSGAYKPPKRDLRELFDIIDAAVAAFAELEAIGPISVIKPGLSALESDLAHGNGTLAAVITTNEDVAGIYEKSGSSGSGSWTLRMLFTTVTSTEFAAIVADVAGALAAIDALTATVGGKASTSSVTALEGRAAALEGRSNYVATSISGTPDALVISTGFGIDTLEAGMTISFRATPGPNTLSTVTIKLDDTDPEPVKRGNGSDLRPRDLLGKQWQQTAEWTGNSWRLISSSQAVEVAEAVATRDDDGVVVTDANDVVPFEIEPSGRPAMPAILAENLSGVSAGWLRRQQLPGVVDRLPMCVGNFVYGQSNALANKADALSTLRSGRNMRTLNAGVRAYAGGGTPEENRATLVPHVEAFVEGVDPTPDRGETSCFGAAEAMLDLIETEQGWGDWASDLMVISAASGEGSTTIAQLMAAEPRQRFLLDVAAAAGFANSRFGAKLAIGALDWNQIEGNVQAGMTGEDWFDEMVAAQASLEADINEARSVETTDDTRVPWIIHQVASWNVYPGATHELARMAVTLAQTDPSRFILMPSYMLEYPDGVHYTAEGHHGIVGPRVGFFNKRILINAQARSTFAPSVPISHDVSGKRAWLPFPTWAGDTLTVDTQRVTKVANKGFTALEDDGTTPATIEDVLVLPTGIEVLFASTIGAGTFLDYALDGAGDAGWNSGPRGNLRTTHGDHVQVRTMQGVKRVDEWIPAFRYQLT